MKLISAVKKTFKNVNKMSVMIIYIGLQFTLGLIAVAIVITLLEGHFGDYVFMISCAKGAQDSALTCGALSLVAAFLCDVGLKDRQKQG